MKMLSIVMFLYSYFIYRFLFKGEINYMLNICIRVFIFVVYNVKNVDIKCE